MLNILKKKQTNLNYDISLYPNDIKKEKNNKIKSSLTKQYNNTIYYPSSSKEWFCTSYTFNKSYLKPLVANDLNLNKLFKSYCNMLLHKIKNPFKRRRHNKSRYSANRLYVSRAELKHTNSKLLIVL